MWDVRKIRTFTWNSTKMSVCISTGTLMVVKGAFKISNKP